MDSTLVLCAACRKPANDAFVISGEGAFFCSDCVRIIELQEIDMPSRIVKQPDGLLARFSTVVDNFTHFGMTKEQAIEVCREDMGRTDAEAKVQRGLDDDLLGLGDQSRKNDGLNRWRDALKTIEAIHGKDMLAEVIKYAQAPEETSPPPTDPITRQFEAE
jgi:hypothetical protein